MSTGPGKPKKHLQRYGWDALAILAMGILLYVGLFGQVFSDVPVYECYAVAFWRGLPAINTLPWSQCAFLAQPQTSHASTSALIQWMQAYHFPAPLIHFVANQNPNQPLHALPYEYPLPALLPFSLPLLVPPYWYQVAFALSMSLVAAVIYGFLRVFRSRPTAMVCALYLVIGGWVTADGRFDLVPSALTLVAIIFGIRKRWLLAFAFLALATVFKFYALVLLLPFLLAQQMQAGAKWANWRRWTPLAVFAAVCTIVAAVSLCLSVEDTLAPLSFFADRPFQVESAAASVLWLLHLVGYPLSLVYAYNSFSVLSPLASPVSLVNMALLGAGLAYTWWLQWRGKIDLAASCLLTLMIVIFTGKVFSPQYLLWLLPLAAYVGESKPKWILAWCLLGGLTTWIFPYLYLLDLVNLENVPPLFYAVIALRNLFFFGMIVALLLSHSREQRATSSLQVDMEEVPVTTTITSPTQEQVEKPEPEDDQQPLRLWHKFALGAILAISAFLNFFALNKQDFFEYYYAAAVKSMLMSWHTFFFASFDPAGFLAIDKPPLGFWIQALSVKLFGYSVFSILLPGALAGVLAVALIFHLVRRVFGPVAGLIAALVLAVSPISVITGRNNVVDSLLVLIVLLAAWMVSKAAETGRLRWLCLCALLVGLGFNIKYLQAYMVLPAFGLVYLLGAPGRWQKKLGYLALALGVLLLVSLCWVTIVDLTPVGQRPIVDSISTNSELDLAFGYNGTFRLMADTTVIDAWAWEIGKPGIARFFEQPVAGQVSWLLPLAFVSLVVLGWNREWHLPLTRQQQALVLWGGWLLTLLVFFSYAHFFHLYYLSMLAPAIAALVGAGVVKLWKDYIRHGWRGWLLPYALLGVGITQVYFLAPFPQWSKLLSVVIIGFCAIAELVLILVRWRFRQHVRRVAGSAATVGLLSLLLAPTVWSAIPLAQEGRVFPMAGPPAQQARIPANLADPLLIHYLLAHQDKTPFLLATMNTESAAPFIIDTDQPVMALGGYAGNKSFLTRQEVIEQIDQGGVRFFLLPPSDDPALNWVSTHCKAVPTGQWQSSPSSRFLVDELTLYDCVEHG